MHFLASPACMRLDTVTSKRKVTLPHYRFQVSQAHSSFHKESTSGLEVRCSHFKCTNKDLLTQANKDFRKMVFGLCMHMKTDRKHSTFFFSKSAKRQNLFYYTASTFFVVGYHQLNTGYITDKETLFSFLLCL